jgi:hypothetical protein
MVKKPKTTKSFFGALFIKCFHNYEFFFSCLSIACSNIWLEVYLGIKKIGKFYNFINLIKMAF